MSPPSAEPVGGRSPTVLPPSLALYTDAALWGLVAGTVLSFAAFLTNPVPDPSFPWATVPASLRLPVTQPRIEHWPVTYTVGIWLWVLCLPGVFFAGYRRAGATTTRATRMWLVGLPAVSMLALSTYCRWFWPKLQPPTWNAPSYTVVCWLYCSSYDPVWSTLALGIAGLGLVVALIGGIRRSGWATVGMAVFGVLSLPLGLPALYAAYCRADGSADGHETSPGTGVV